MGYLKINYGNSCDLGNIYYSGGFKNVVYLETGLSKPEYETQEEGYENGDGVFVKTSERLIKKNVFTLIAPEYMVDALKAMALCDDVKISDTDGLFYHSARNIEVNIEPEEISNSCMFSIEVKYQIDDQIVKSSCCTNM